MSARTFLGGLALGGIVGGALGAWMARPDPVVTGVTPAKTAGLARRMICASTAPAAVAQDEEQALRLRWCEARLAEQTRDKPTAAQPWPEALPDDEEPSAWGDAMDAALAACGAAGQAELTDCEEYPCVLALRPPAGVEPHVVADALSGCLDEHLPEGLADNAGALVFDATCPDGSQEPVVLVTAASEAGLSSVLTPQQREGFGEIVYIGATLGRRTESALQLWRCKSDE